jgi:ABC-type glycerol-3-phosphate transport system substrate-binding protein
LKKFPKLEELIMSKRLFYIIGLLAVGALLLGACAPAATPTPEVIEKEVEVVKTVVVTEIIEGETVEKIVEVTPTPEPVIEVEKPTGNITLWGWTAAIRDTMEAAGVVDDFYAEYPDTEVEITYYAPNDVYTNLPLALTAGEGACDVCLVENSHISEYVHLGGLLDLTELVQPYLDIMNDYKWADCELDGRYYCMPWDSGPVVMYYRRDVFDAAGLPSDPESVSELVSTWDKYFETCETIKQETGNFCFAHNKANNFGRLYEMALWQQGLGYYDPASGEVTVDSPENVATLEMFGEFWDADLTSDNLEWNDPWYAELASLEEPIATLVEASWMEIFLKSWIAPGTSGKWGVALMPAWEEGQVRAANDGGSAFVITEQTENPDLAWAFVEFALGLEESQEKMFAISGLIPSLETTYESALFLQGDSFLGGQNARAVYADVVQEIPVAGIYGPNYSMMNGIVSTAIQLFSTGELSAEEALADAAAEIRANLE